MKAIKMVLLFIIVSISLLGCGNGGFSKSEINTAVNYAKGYLEYDVIGNLVGLSFNYSEPKIEKTGDDFCIVSFYAELYNKWSNEFDEPYYVELTVSEDQIYVGYTYQSLYEYMLEAYGSTMKYSAVIYWDGTFEYLQLDSENNTTNDYDSNQYYNEPVLVDGNRFECFETASGKDEILTIYLFEDKSTGETLYKGAFDSGLEFWFSYYGNTVSYETGTPKEFVEYKIDCLDGSDAFLKHGGSEIELIAEEGEAYGNMYQYSGTYIGLPDTIEE